MSLRRPFRIALTIPLLIVGLALIPSESAMAATITSEGPLRTIDISTELNCAVNHTSDTLPEWYGSTACATLISLNGTLFGPRNIPAGGSAAPRTAYTPVSQTGVTGSGTAADPYTIVTVVRAGDLAIVTQTDSYVVGREFYTTSVAVDNISGGTLTGNIYTAGDCYLQNSDWGYGQIIGSAPACATGTEPGSRLVALLPQTGGNNFYVAWYHEVWAAIGMQQPFPDTCLCDEFIDNGMGLSWPVNIPAGGSRSWSWNTDFSPEGHVPLNMTASAHSPASPPGGFNGYRITVQNGNPENATVHEVTVTLPPGFTYLPGSTTGVTTADPDIAGRVLTWTGPFELSGGGQITFDFDVRVTGTPGTYTIDATATADHDVTPAENAASITVEAAADMALTKTASRDEVPQGGTFTYNLIARNEGPSPVPDAFITDTLPAGFTFNAGLSSPGCFAIGQGVRCNLGALTADQVRTATVGVTVAGSAPEGYAYNSAELHGEINDPNPINNPVTAPVLVTQGTLVVSKTATPVFAGNELTWNIGVTNNGDTTETGAVVTDTLPERLTYVRATTASGSCDFDPASRTVTCTLGRLDPGERATIAIVTDTPPDLVPASETRTTVPDTASVAPAGGGIVDTTTFGATVFAAAHVVPAKTVAPSPLVAGDLATYRITVTNEGPSVATRLNVTDTLPPELTFDAAASDDRCRLIDPTTGTVRCAEAGPVDVGARATFTVVARIDPTVGDGSSVVNDAVASALQFDPAPAPAATAPSLVVRRSDLSITKRPSRTEVHAGERFFYIITATNNGPSAASDIVLTDRAGRSLRGGLRAGAKGLPDCTAAGVSFRCEIPELLPGDGVAFTVPVRVPPNTPSGTICNTASQRSASREIRTANNSATACIEVIGRAKPSPSPSATPPSPTQPPTEPPPAQPPAPGSRADARDDGGLPGTGLALAGLATGALTLIGGGIVIARAARRRHG